MAYIYTTFAAYKRQRFRWCFGSMQVLRQRLRSLLPAVRPHERSLRAGQKFDYLHGFLVWLHHLVILIFALQFVGISAACWLTGRAFPHWLYRDLMVAAPMLYIGMGGVRYLWALMVRCRCSLKQAVEAYINMCSVSWVVACACVRGLLIGRMPFQRTPKREPRSRLREALAATRAETALGLLILLFTVGTWGSQPDVTTVLLSLILLHSAFFYLSSLVCALQSCQGRVSAVVAQPLLAAQEKQYQT